MAVKKPRQTVFIEHGLKRLSEDKKYSVSPQDPNPKCLTLGDIATLPSVFQPRNISADPLASEKHIAVLVNAIKNEPSHHLDPISVWWSGKEWYVIDGHHRYQAYIHTEKSKKLKIGSVPIEVFQGTLEEAIRRSLNANLKDKLRMSPKDKLNSAWRLVCLGGYSKTEIQTMTGASTSTVASMRKKLAEIQVDFPDKRSRIKNYAAIGMTWGEARHHGKEHIDFDDDAAREEMVKLARALGDHFGNQLASNPQITAGALEIYSENLCNRIKALWAEDIELLFEDSEDE